MGIPTLDVAYVIITEAVLLQWLVEILHAQKMYTWEPQHLGYASQV